MPGLGSANLIAELLFGSIGFVAFVYGKRQQLWRTLFLGLALMAYPYFVDSPTLLYSLGVLLTVALFF